MKLLEAPRRLLEAPRNLLEAPRSLLEPVSPRRRLPGCLLGPLVLPPGASGLYPAPHRAGSAPHRTAPCRTAPHRRRERHGERTGWKKCPRNVRALSGEAWTFLEIVFEARSTTLWRSQNILGMIEKLPPAMLEHCLAKTGILKASKIFFGDHNTWDHLQRQSRNHAFSV